MSDATGIDTQGRGILEWGFGEDLIVLSAFHNNSRRMGVAVVLTPDEARQVIAGLERMVEAVEMT